MTRGRDVKQYFGIVLMHRLRTALRRKPEAASEPTVFVCGSRHRLRPRAPTSNPWTDIARRVAA